MKSKIKVAVLGGTGAVGQKLVALLSSHHLFDLIEITASENSAGKVYAEAINWREDITLPPKIANLIVQNCTSELNAEILFSGLDAKVAGEVETFYAHKGYVVISNSKNHRMDKDVPLVIPEINLDHFGLIKMQQTKNNKGGCIITNPNCSITIAALALAPIYKNFGLEKVMITTMQALSGAGYPGVSSMDIIDNVIPYIKDEEEKMEIELLKIFGQYSSGRIIPADIKVSAMCNRVPVRHGHTMAISFTAHRKVDKTAIIAEIKKFSSEWVKQNACKGMSFSSNPLQYLDDPARPQPIFDRDAGFGMTVSIGNLRACNVLDWKFTAMGHNLIRGAAGAAILNAEQFVRYKEKLC